MIKVQKQSSGGSSSVAKGVQFLSPNHVTSKAGHVATVTKMTVDAPDNFGNPYVLHIVMDGQKYTKGFKPTSVNLADIVDVLGDDEKKYAGKKILVSKTSNEDEGDRLVFSAAPKG